jgi:hypothetical protein
MARLIASMALVALGLSGASFHEPFPADGRQRSMTVTERSDRYPPQRHGNLTTRSNRTVEQVIALPNWAVVDQGGSAAPGRARAGLRPWGPTRHGAPGNQAPADLPGPIGSITRPRQMAPYLSATLMFWLWPS